MGETYLAAELSDEERLKGKSLAHLGILSVLLHIFECEAWSIHFWMQGKVGNTLLHPKERGSVLTESEIVFQFLTFVLFP